MSTSLVANFPKKKLLIVDDDALWRETLADFLSERWEITQCANGRAAVEYLERHSHDVSLIVSDFKMPMMSGDKMIEWMLSRGLQLPMVIVTGRADVVVDNLMVQQYGAVTLQKPVELSDIETVIANTLRHVSIVPK